MRSTADRHSMKLEAGVESQGTIEGTFFDVLAFAGAGSVLPFSQTKQARVMGVTL